MLLWAGSVIVPMVLYIGKDMKDKYLLINTSNQKVTQTDKDDAVAVVGVDFSTPIENVIVDQGKGANKAAIINAKNSSINQGDGGNELTVTLVKDSTFTQGSGADTVFLDNVKKVTVNQGGGDDTITIESPFDSILARSEGKTPIHFNGGTHLNGGTGKDKVVIVGKREDYNITLVDNPAHEVRITHKNQKASDGGLMRLQNYEKIDFSGDVLDSHVSYSMDIATEAVALKAMGVTEADENAIQAFINKPKPAKAPAK
jgi:hypothetical protein